MHHPEANRPHLIIKAHRSTSRILINVRLTIYMTPMMLDDNFIQNSQDIRKWINNV